MKVAVVFLFSEQAFQTTMKKKHPMLSDYIRIFRASVIKLRICGSSATSGRQRI